MYPEHLTVTLDAAAGDISFVMRDETAAEGDRSVDRQGEGSLRHEASVAEECERKAELAVRLARWTRSESRASCRDARASACTSASRAATTRHFLPAGRLADHIGSRGALH
jgi:hypothetical protein